ncbi:MAG: hypothetical protein KJ626_07580, partial [Verrucomicrobia bacterium]|nr:hypothetical protein [Verrucomicrobiota bacterium]
SESSSERTHNARRYATLPGGGAVPPCGIDPSFRRGPARLGAASVAPPTTFDASIAAKRVAARMGRSTWPRCWPPTSRRCAEGVQVSGQRPRTPSPERVSA